MMRGVVTEGALLERTTDRRRCTVLTVEPGGNAILVPDTGGIPTVVTVRPDGRLFPATQENYRFLGIDISDKVNGIRVGDRVRAKGIRASTGKVVALTGNGWLRVEWDRGGDSGVIKASDVDLVPTAPSAEAPTKGMPVRAGDRVRHNGKVSEDFRRLGGTAMSVNVTGLSVVVKWDGMLQLREELGSQLEVIHRPKSPEVDSSVQPILDLLDAEGKATSEKIEELQSHLRALNEAKRILSAGVA